MSTPAISLPDLTPRLAPIRPINGFSEMQRLMHLRKWRQSVATRTPDEMTDDARRIYNASVRIPLPIEQQALTLLEHSAATGLTGTNSLMWLQGPPGAGKTDLAREIAAQYTDPISVGAPALPSSTNINYAHIPIAETAAQGDQLAGLAHAGCRWFGIDPGKTGSESTDILAQAMYNCRTQVLIIDDLHTASQGHAGVNALRVLLNKVPAHVILVSLSPDYVEKPSIAGALVHRIPSAQQILARTKKVKLGGSSHQSKATMRSAIIDALARFKLCAPCPQPGAIAEWFIENRHQDGLATLPLVFKGLRGIAARAVGSTETITLRDVLETEFE